MPTEAELVEINKAHAPNWMGHTLLQRVAFQLSHDCVQAYRNDDKAKAETLAKAAGLLERLAFAPDFKAMYAAALAITTYASMTDAELRAAWLRTDGEVGDPVADALAAEMERRGVDV